MSVYDREWERQQAAQDDHDYANDVTIVLTRDDVSKFFASVADLEEYRMRVDLSAEQDVAEAIFNLSAVASEVGQQVDLDL